MVFGAILTAVGVMLSSIPQSLALEPSYDWCVRCYCSADKQVVLTIDNATKFGDNECVNPDLKTIFGIHGYREGPDKPEIAVFLKFKQDSGLSKDHNYCLVDWSKKATAIVVAPLLDYPLVVANSYEIAKQFLKFLLILLENCLDRLKLHMIGFSLGGQIAGYVCKNLTDQGKQCARVTAIDPAQPGFEVTQYVTKDIAAFVDVYHLTKILGVQKAIGTCDFFINYCCLNQPGCIEEYCSHIRGPFVFMETTTNPAGQQAVSAPNGTVWCANKVPCDNPINAGYWVPQSCSGSYYYSTGSQSPYSLGAAGTQPTPCC